MVSGTVLMPTACAPMLRSQRISAGVSNCGPITQAYTPSCNVMPWARATLRTVAHSLGS